MPSVAIIDDQPEVRDLIQRLLARREYDVRCYESADELESILADPPDLALVDVNLEGEVSGLELVSRLRSVYPDDVLPMIMISGLSSEEDFLRGFAAGASDYLGKPFSPAELLAKCAHHLTRRERVDATACIPATAPLPGGFSDAFGRYRIDGSLGQGSYAVVYDAWDKLRDRQVALKVLMPSALMHPESKARFLHEIVALASVRSPHLARLIDHGQAEGRHYLAMEHVDGTDLKTWIRGHGPLTDDELIELLGGLGLGLRALRDAELVHRDIKPSNVILRDDDPSQPVLVDFGLARGPLTRGVTTEGILVGSPGYMAPEYVNGEDAGYRSDLFALGQVALFARSGTPPFQHLNGFELLRVMASHPVPIPEWLDDGLAELIRALTQLDPERRIPSAEVLLTRLRRLRKPASAA